MVDLSCIINSKLAERAIKMSVYSKLRNFLTRRNDNNHLWLLREKAIKSRSPLKYWYKLRWFRATQRLCAYIPLSTEFAERPSFPHGMTGIFTSAGAKIGKGCTIFHQVTIGSNTLKDSKNPGAPVIGDNVYIGAGAKIIGGIRIGNNVRIGANCVVTCDIPDNATVVLPAPRIIEREQPKDNTFHAWKE